MPKFLPRIGSGAAKRWLGSSVLNAGGVKRASAELSPISRISTPVHAMDIPDSGVYEQQLSLMEGAYTSKTPELSRGSNLNLDTKGCLSKCCRNSPAVKAHVIELVAFVGWAAVGIPSAVQLPLLWFVFWEYVCSYGDKELLNADQDVPLFHLKALCLWLLWLSTTIYYRRGFHFASPQDISDFIRYLEFFVFSALVVTLSANVCSFLHTPAQPLFDLGFSVIPAQSLDSPWRPVSDILAQFLPAVLVLRSVWMRRSIRCSILANWLRCVGLAYIFRALTVTLTSLPGPAPHCNNSETYHPPAGWHDIATRLGPMVGDYSTCGDLIFSGHTAFTNMTMLCLVKTFKGSKWYNAARILGPLYVLTMATFALAGRKHYSVDIAVALLVSSLTFYRFQDGWVANSNRLPSNTLLMTRKDTIDLPTEPLDVHKPFSRQSTNSRIQLV